jgi:hypothetical protein
MIRDPNGKELEQFAKRTLASVKKREEQGHLEGGSA